MIPSLFVLAGMFTTGGVASAQQTQQAPAFVPVPPQYVYNPDLGSLHDFRTTSPDSYFSADFRGPCAVHDLCYEAPGNHKAECDAGLRRDLSSNCDVVYDGRDLNDCNSTADQYYYAVINFGEDPAAVPGTAGTPILPGEPATDGPVTP